MNIRSILLLCLVFVSLPWLVSGQKMKDKRAKINFIALPTDTLPASYTTYSVRVYGANASIGGLSSSDLAGRVKMDGFKRVGSSASEFGHIRISVNTGNMDSGRPEYKSHTSISKTKEGKEIRTTTYWYEIYCSTHYSYSIMDVDGNTLFEKSHASADNIKSRVYNSSSELSKAYRAIVSSIRKNFASTAANNAVNQAYSSVRTKYAFAHSSEDIQLYTIKKHPEEAVFEAHLENSIAFLDTLKGWVPASIALAKLAPAMDFWKKQADKNTGTDKDLQEVFIACNSNLAHLSFFMDRPDDADRYARSVLAISKDKRMENLLDFMSKTKYKMDLHGIYSMRYFRDLSEAIPPSKVIAIEQEKEQLQLENNSLSGMIILDKDTIHGMFVRSKTEEDFVFGPNGNTKFVEETLDGLKDYDLSTQQIGRFFIGERMFTKTTYSPCAKGKTEPAMHILEEIYTADKITVYKYYPSGSALSNEKIEYAFKKKNENVPVSILDTQFLLWDKGLAAYFSDCADLQQLALSGGFKSMEEDLVKAARVYSEVCQ